MSKLCIYILQQFRNKTYKLIIFTKSIYQQQILQSSPSRDEQTVGNGFWVLLFWIEKEIWMHQTITGVRVSFLYVWILILGVWWAAVTIGAVDSVPILFGLFVVVSRGSGGGNSSSAFLCHFAHWKRPLYCRGRFTERTKEFEPKLKVWVWRNNYILCFYSFIWLWYRHFYSRVDSISAQSQLRS